MLHPSVVLLRPCAHLCMQHHETVSPDGTDVGVAQDPVPEVLGPHLTLCSEITLGRLKSSIWDAWDSNLDQLNPDQPPARQSPSLLCYYCSGPLMSGDSHPGLTSPFQVEFCTARPKPILVRGNWISSCVWQCMHTCTCILYVYTSMHM